MEKNSIIQNIVEEEWIQFTNTKNIGSRAVCQDQKGNFTASRRAYWQMYNEDILNSYLADIKAAKRENINLITQKYGYMMSSTDKENYEKIKSRLMPVNEQKEKLISSIMLIYMAWEEEITKNYPTLDNKNRILYSYNDTKNSTSVQTYMKGELATYSARTLALILQYFLTQASLKNNLVYKYMSKLNSYENTSKNNFCTSETLNSCSSNKVIDNMDLKSAELLADFAKNTAIYMNLPIVITVVDKFANTILFKKMDNALVASIDISPAKAKTALAFKKDTYSLSQDSLSKSLNNFNPPSTKYCFLGGGIPIFVNDTLIGAIGISGGSVEQDIQIGQTSIEKFLKI